MSKLRPYIPLLLVLAVVVALFVSPYFGKSPVAAQKKAKGPTPVMIARVARGDLTQTYEAVGSVAGPEAKAALVVVKVPEDVAARLKPGASATVRVDAVGDKVLRATIAHIVPFAEPVSHQVIVELDIETAVPGLKPGLMARVAFVTASRGQTLTLDRAAIADDPDSGKVKLLVVRDNRVETRQVRLGLVGEARAEILDGLVEGDAVVARGGANLKDGAEVKIANADAPAKNR